MCPYQCFHSRHITHKDPIRAGTSSFHRDSFYQSLDWFKKRRLVCCMAGISYLGSYNRRSWVQIQNRLHKKSSLQKAKAKTKTNKQKHPKSSKTQNKSLRIIIVSIHKERYPWFQGSSTECSRKCYILSSIYY